MGRQGLFKGEKALLKRKSDRGKMAAVVEVNPTQAERMGIETQETVGKSFGGTG